MNLKDLRESISDTASKKINESDDEPFKFYSILDNQVTNFIHKEFKVNGGDEFVMNNYISALSDYLTEFRDQIIDDLEEVRDEVLKRSRVHIISDK